MKNMKIFDIDWKKLGVVLLADLTSSVTVLLSLIAGFSILGFVIPKNIIPQDSWNLATTQELQLMRDELISFLVVFLAIMIVVLAVSLFIFTVSRKFIWGYLNNQKRMFEGFWKYLIFLTGSVIAINLVAFLIALGITLFFGYLQYLMSLISPVIQLYLIVIIPWLVLMYLSMLLTYYLNNSYFQNRTDIKKTLRSLKKLELKRYLKPIGFIALVSWLVHILVYLAFPGSSNTLSFIIILTYTVQASYLKIIVNSYEKKRLLGLFKRK